MKAKKSYEPTWSHYVVVKCMNGQVVSGHLPTREAAQKFLEERAKTMGLSVHAYYIKGEK